MLIDTTRVTVALATAIVLAQPVTGLTAEAYVDPSEEALKTMDIGRAMDLVAAHKGHYWLRTPRWTCAYVKESGERGVDNYGVKFENYIGLLADKEVTDPQIGTAIFVYPQVPKTFCRVPIRLESYQDSAELAAAFTMLARESEANRRTAIAARYALNADQVSSMDRFLTTESSLEIAKVLLQDHLQSLVQPGGSGEYIAAAAPLPAGSAITISDHYKMETREPDQILESTLELTASGADGFETRHTRGGQVFECRDRQYFRSMMRDAPEICRRPGGSTIKSSILFQEGQAALLPTNFNMPTLFDEEVEEVTRFSSGKEFVARNRYIRACIAEGADSVTTPAGVFDSVRFLCGSVMVSDSRHEKVLGTVWVDRSSGLPIEETREVHSVSGSQRFRLETQITSLIRP